MSEKSLEAILDGGPSHNPAQRDVKRRKTRLFNIPRPSSALPAFPSHRTQRKPVPTSESDFTFQEDDVFKEAIEEVHSDSDGVDIPDIPRYDSLDQYGVKDEDYHELLRTEVKRLVNIAKSSGPFLLRNKDFGETTKTSYEELSALASKIVWDCATITLENQSLTVEQFESPLVIEHCVKSFKMAYSTLMNNYVSENKNTTKKPKLPEPPETCRKLYFALVEYVTGTLARFFVRIVASDQWNKQTLAILAKIAVKLKFIAKDSEKYAQAALERADDAIATHAQEAVEVKTIIILQENMEGKGVEEKRVKMQDTDDSAALHALDSLTLRNIMMEVFTGTLSSLCNPKTSEHGFDSFHHHAVVYETGFDRSLVMVTEFRDGYVTTTSNPTHLDICSRALSLVRQNIEAIHGARTPVRPVGENICHINLEWEEREVDGTDSKPQDKDLHLETTSLDAVISVLLPLGFNSSKTAAALENLLQISTFLSKKLPEEPIRRFKSTSFQARCSVQTSLDRISELKVQHYDTVSISKCGTIGKMKAGALLDSAKARTLTDCYLDGQKLKDTQVGTQLSSEMLVQYSQEDLKMREWIFSATSVTVPCRAFVLTTLSVCAVLIIGALVMPFMIKNRIPGVDPFQITMFTWLMVGVILLAAKSRYVSVWPWHDFIHGRVVCHSVADLADVTGVDKQMILLKLLNNEYSTTLLSKGPYNGMFSRRVDDMFGLWSEAFSIDEPVHLTTMLASGFIVLKVLSTQGEHLICLDARKKTVPDYAVSRMHSASYLCCLDLPSDEDQGKRWNDVLYLKRNQIGWYKLEGLYFANAVFG